MWHCLRVLTFFTLTLVQSTLLLWWAEVYRKQITLNCQIELAVERMVCLVFASRPTKLGLSVKSRRYINNSTSAKPKWRRTIQAILLKVPGRRVPDSGREDSRNRGVLGTWPVPSAWWTPSQSLGHLRIDRQISCCVLAKGCGFFGGNNSALGAANPLGDYQV